MKYFCIVGLALVAVCAADRTYKGDEGVDVDALIDDPIRLKSLLECLADDSKCSLLETALKKDVVPAIGTACAECTPEQKHTVYKFLETVKKDFPAHFESMQKNFDPEDKLFKALYQALEGYKN